MSTSNTNCFHCGDTVPRGSDFSADIAGVSQPMCCPGCCAVAQLIAGAGLESFYRHRTTFNERPDLSEIESENHFTLYDDPEISKAFTDLDEQELTHARILVGGISCAACTWLIEEGLKQKAGIEAASVNLSSSRLDVKYDARRVPTSEIFKQVERLGYKCRPFQTNTQRTQAADEYRTSLRQLAVAGLGMMQVGMFAIALHAGDIQGIEAEYQKLLRWVSLLVASFVVTYSARPFFQSAWRHLKAGALVMDLPVSLAIGLAWVASVWATVSGQGQVYFDSVVMFTFFLLLGRFLERRARQKDELAWFDAESVLPTSVKVWREDQWQESARLQLERGDIVLITKGETVPADAVVTDGASAINESTFNGEHLPRAVMTGDTVYAGTLNIDGALQARVSGSYIDTRLAALQRSVEQAQLEKPAIAQLADRIASKFIAMVLLVTGITAAVWYTIDPSQTLWVSLSVLVVSCPCALALATPAALTNAANALRRSGVIVRGENALEALSKSTHLLFDKTGTLTRGDFQLSTVQALSGKTENDVLALAASLQRFSSHPLATAFSEIPANLKLENTQYHTGSGLEGSIAGNRYRIGSDSFCRALNPDLPLQPSRDDIYWIALTTPDEAIAWIGLRDTLREEAAQVVADAKNAGLKVELVTGDSSGQGPALAETLGIPKVHRGFSPQQKMERVETLQKQGAIVSMVGDGLNDAPVLGLANASFAVAGATELARTQADFIVVDGDLQSITYTYEMARQCRRIIAQNLAWALSYNLTGIPLAALGYIPPWLAAIGMSASSLLVVLNSLRLNRFSTPTRA